MNKVAKIPAAMRDSFLYFLSGAMAAAGNGALSQKERDALRMHAGKTAALVAGELRVVMRITPGGGFAAASALVEGDAVVRLSAGVCAALASGKKPPLRLEGDAALLEALQSLRAAQSHKAAQPLGAVWAMAQTLARAVDRRQPPARRLVADLLRPLLAGGEELQKARARADKLAARAEKLAASL